MIAERENALLKEQELYNRLRNKDYGPAIALALELKRPQKLWGVLRDVMTEGMGEGAPGADDDGEGVHPQCRWSMSTKMRRIMLSRQCWSWCAFGELLCMHACGGFTSLS